MAWGDFKLRRLGRISGSNPRWDVPSSPDWRAFSVQLNDAIADIQPSHQPPPPRAKCGALGRHDKPCRQKITAERPCKYHGTTP